VSGTGATTYAYNLDRQLTTITRPDTQTLSLGYDSAGRLSTQTLPSNETITYAYDATTQQLHSITGPGSETLTFSYDGNLLNSEAWSGTITGTVSRTYDTDFRVATQSVNSSNPVSFGYDADSLLTAAGAQTITRSSQTGLVTGTILGGSSGVTDAWTYDNFGQPATYTASYNGTPIFSQAYTRDALSRIAEKTETIQGVTTVYAYNYDDAGWLTDVYQNGDVVSHYDYDANSNRTDGYTPVQGTISSTSYDNQDRLLSYTTTTGTSTYTYAANGELASKTDGSGTTTYTYDVLGNLRSVTLPDTTQLDYVVDGQNRRIGKTVNGTLVQGFLYDGQLRIAAELDGSGGVVNRFVYGEKANVPEYMVKSGATYRLITDHLGSPRLVVSAADGTLMQRMDYDEFGNVIADTSPGFQPFGFAGGLYDRDTKLVRFGARDYDAAIGRWTTKDPIRFDGGDVSLYRYVLADPIDLTDPQGTEVLNFQRVISSCEAHIVLDSTCPTQTRLIYECENVICLYRNEFGSACQLSIPGTQQKVRLDGGCRPVPPNPDQCVG
jgi:RHS repeat-associated protein